MFIEERHLQIITELKENPEISVRELSEKLFVSEPTVRRDLSELHRRGLITKVYGGAILNSGAADREIPFLLRENEKSTGKAEMGRKAARLIRDGSVIMLDASTSAYHIVPYLTRFKDLIVITSGAKTAVALAEKEIRTFCTGGQMIIHSFSYVGDSAEKFVRNLNADMMFFSCRGLTLDGKMSDPSVEEANLRRVMFESCKKRYLLCASDKIGKSYLHNMGSVSETDGIISDNPLPSPLSEKEIV